MLLCVLASKKANKHSKKQRYKTVGGVLMEAGWALLTSKWNKNGVGAHTHTHTLTPLSGNVVHASSVVAHRLSIRVSAEGNSERRRRVKGVGVGVRRPGRCSQESGKSSL